MTVTMSTDTVTPLPVQQDGMARIMEVSLRQHTTYTMPRDLADTVVAGLDAWRLTYGLRSKPTIARVIDLMERTTHPDIRRQMTVEVQPSKPFVRGIEADVLITETSFTDAEDTRSQHPRYVWKRQKAALTARARAIVETEKGVPESDAWERVANDPALTHREISYCRTRAARLRALTLS